MLYSESGRFHPWNLGFKQYGLHHGARVSQVCAFSIFRRLPLRRHAPVPSSFRPRV